MIARFLGIILAILGFVFDSQVLFFFGAGICLLQETINAIFGNIGPYGILITIVGLLVGFLVDGVAGAAWAIVLIGAVESIVLFGIGLFVKKGRG